MASPAHRSHDQDGQLHAHLASVIGQHIGPRRVRCCVLVVELEPEAAAMDGADDLCVIADSSQNPAEVSGLIIRAADRFLTGG